MSSTAQAYAGERIMHDADSHVMETPEWLTEFADPSIREKVTNFYREGASRIESLVEKARQRQTDPQLAEEAASDLIAGPKGWQAYGAFDAKERSEALDRLGFKSQLVFATASLAAFRRATEHDLLYGGARAHNRAMAAFCANDPRLLGVGYVPTADPELAVKEFDEAVRLGCKAIWLPATPAGERSPGHPDFDPLWARFQETGIPFMLHIGPQTRALPKEYVNNGLPRSPDLHGGGENLRFKDFVVLPFAAQMFLSALIYDGVFERFPGLRGGVIEFGAVWVPGFLRALDHGFRAFRKTDPLLQKMELKPSEQIRRHMKFTPFPSEDAGYLIRDAGSDLFLFSSDYPHPEGTNDPIGRFERTFEGLSEQDKERFYRANFEEMMGAVLA